MRLRSISIPFLLLALIHAAELRADSREILLSEVLERAEKHDPGIAASKSKDLAAEKTVSVLKAQYLPTLDFEAIDTTGFPGSSSVLGIGGLMGSSFRSGPAAGFVLKQTVWDFGRTSNAVESAEFLSKAQGDTTAIYSNQVRLEASKAYFDCVRFVSLTDTWAFIFDNASAVAKEVNRFVSTGQRSIVEKYLVASQAEEAQTARAAYEQKAGITKKRLGLLIGMNDSDIQCPRLEKIDSDVSKLVSPAAINLFVSKASSENEAAQSRLSGAKSEHLPKIVAFASAGSMQDSRLVAESNYAVGAGIVLPIFDGWRTTSEVHRAEAEAAEREHLVDANRQFVETTNSRFDEIIAAEQIRVEHLLDELRLAEEAFKVAHERYYAFKGTLIDVREALKNLSRTKTQLIESKTELLAARLAKSLFAAGAKK